MKKKLSISTKTGDRGESGLANGQRIGKDELVFDVLGTQDELNSWLGLCIANLTTTFDKEKTFLLEIQDTLFYIGAELAQSPKAQLQKPALDKLETHSTQLQKSMEEGWTTKFLYPGGNETAAMLDVARTVSRRLERLIVKLSRQQSVSDIILKYVNRLSDYLFVLRCFVNQEEKVAEHAFAYKQELEKKIRRN